MTLIQLFLENKLFLEDNEDDVFDGFVLDAIQALPDDQRRDIGKLPIDSVVGVECIRAYGAMRAAQSQCCDVVDQLANALVRQWVIYIRG